MEPGVRIGDLRIEPPLVNGSGVVDAVAADDAWNLPPGVLSQLGAFTTKTITRAPRTGHPEPRAETFGEGTLVNAAGLPNPGIFAAMHEWRHLPASLATPVIVSIGGAAADLADLAAQVAEARWASALELNLSCPNVAGGLVAADPVAVRHVVATVRARTNLPLIAKLTPACGVLGAVARAAEAAGADAINCGNTMPVRAIDPTTGGPLLGAGPDGGLSGLGLHPIALRMVAEVSAAVSIPVIGLGGVDGVAAARRMFDAGAAVVGLGTAAVFDAGVVATIAEALASPGAAAP